MLTLQVALCVEVLVGMVPKDIFVCYLKQIKKQIVGVWYSKREGLMFGNKSSPLIRPSEKFRLDLKRIAHKSMSFSTCCWEPSNIDIVKVGCRVDRFGLLSENHLF